MNGISSDSIKIIMGQVDDMCSAAFYCIKKTAIFTASTCIRE